jgi:Family of unknown function (DUF6338)
MPATVEALLILLVFVMPGFVTVRTKETLVPTIGKAQPLDVTLRSITVSLLYLPLWLVFAPDLLSLRAGLSAAVQQPITRPDLVLDRGVVVFVALSVMIPGVIGTLWAVAYCNDWYLKATRHIYARLGIPSPHAGIGEDVWDRLWLNREGQPWLTVFMKDGRIYTGRGVEFSLSAYGKDLVLGPDVKMFDKDGRLSRDLVESRSEGVWIPAAEIASVDIHG